jgi:hypothetical protein
MQLSLLQPAMAGGGSGVENSKPATSLLGAFWKFLRPHTIRGTLLGTTMVVTRALMGSPEVLLAHPQLPLAHLLLRASLSRQVHEKPRLHYLSISPRDLVLVFLLHFLPPLGHRLVLASPRVVWATCAPLWQRLHRGHQPDI